METDLLDYETDNKLNTSSWTFYFLTWQENATAINKYILSALISAMNVNNTNC